jgi:hypothetical protein
MPKARTNVQAESRFERDLCKIARLCTSANGTPLFVHAQSSQILSFQPVVVGVTPSREMDRLPPSTWTRSVRNL